MKINPKHVLSNFEGKPIKDGDKDLTLGNVISFTLLQAKSENPYRSYLLAKDIFKKDLNLSNDDCIFIRKTLEKAERAPGVPFWTPMVIGQVIEILEGGKDDEPVKAKK